MHQFTRMEWALAGIFTDALGGYRYSLPITILVLALLFRVPFKIRDIHSDGATRGRFRRRHGYAALMHKTPTKKPDTLPATVTNKNKRTP